jgi:hypothetical protein
MLYGLDLFSGIGGITLALQPWIEPFAYCEIESYCQSVLLQRMQEGNLPKAPIWDDIRTLSLKDCCFIDIIYGGFPCQDISVAGLQRRERWFLLASADSSKCRQSEFGGFRTQETKEIANREDNNSSRKFDGTSEVWLSDKDNVVHSDNKRNDTPEYANNERKKILQSGGDSLDKLSGYGYDVSDPECKGLEGQCESERIQKTYADIGDSRYWAVEPELCGIFNDVSEGLDKIKGNKIDETLRILWERNDSTEMVKWKIGFYFQKSEVLFKEMLRRLDYFIEKCEIIKWKKTSAKEDEIDSLCKLWTDKEFTKTPYRQESVEQQSKEFNSAMSNLSQKRTYKRYDLGKMWNEEDTYELTTKETKNRVNRIKALGNSVVPLQVREAFKILMGIK